MNDEPTRAAKCHHCNQPPEITWVSSDDAGNEYAKIACSYCTSKIDGLFPDTESAREAWNRYQIKILTTKNGQL